MGMTDKQFNGCMHLVLDIRDVVRNEPDPEEKNEKLTRLIEHIRDTIGD